MSVKLTISPDYAAHWGLWEAMRELVQNAYDERDADPECHVSFFREGGTVFLKTDRGQLSRKSLLLGQSDKRSSPYMRGKFGEGYKLALLVLCRLGHEVLIANGDKIWKPILESDPQFDGAQVLSIQIQEGDPKHEGVLFTIHGVSWDQWQEIQNNLTDKYGILDDPAQVGRIYSGGLFVSKIDEFKKGYSFKPGVLELDRDRSMILTFDLAMHTSRLWTERGGEESADLVADGAPDVNYIEYTSQMSSPVTVACLASFTKKHGNAIPVSSQEEVQRAQAAGMKWALVPAALKGLLSRVINIFIPSTKTPKERLMALAEKYSHDKFLSAELKDIAEKV